MPMHPPDKRRRQDKTIFRLAVLGRGDQRFTRPIVIGAAFKRDELKSDIDRQRKEGYEVIVEKAELPEDIVWERVL